MDNFDLLQKKLEKLIKNYNVVKDEVSRLKAENTFLNNEIKKLRKNNFDLMDFKNNQNKVIAKIKKIIRKIDSLKGV
jgi:prefoldin subunit 5